MKQNLDIAPIQKRFIKKNRLLKNGCRIEKAYQVKITKLTTFANTLKAHKWEALVQYDYHISTRKLEEINNKIKTTKNTSNKIIEIKGSLSLKFWQCIRKTTYLSDEQKRKMKVMF